jgi:radical SAM/SPASM domain protein of ACGX system
MDPYFSFQWHITEQCDQRCEHCYIFSERSGTALTEMPLGDIERILDNCLDFCEKFNRIPYFYLTGGDPLLHKDFWRALELLKAKELGFSILGNPFHLTREVCEKLNSYGCQKYQLSLDGLKATHDRIRKEGSFDATLEAIPLINEAGMTSVIMTTVTGENLHETPALVDLAARHKVAVFAFARYCPTSLEKSLRIAPADYRALLEKCWEKFEAYQDGDTIFNLKDHLWTLFLYEKGLFAIPEHLQENLIYDGCNCGISHVTILPDGGVFACRRMESPVGNALADSLYDIFLGDKMNAYREYERFEKCSKCELLRFCRGCPAVAYGSTHSFYSPDPQCWKTVV